MNPVPVVINLHAAGTCCAAVAHHSDKLMMQYSAVFLPMPVTSLHHTHARHPAHAALFAQRLARFLRILYRVLVRLTERGLGHTAVRVGPVRLHGDDRVAQPCVRLRGERLPCAAP